MSNRFEQEIQHSYNTSQIANLEYITINDKQKPNLSNCFNNLACIYSHLNLFCKVSLKNYKQILENQNKLEVLLKENLERLEDCEAQTQKSNSENLKQLQQLYTELKTHKPLTRKEVFLLVQEIAKQPKIVEKEALKLTENLNQKVQLVEALIKEVKELIGG